MSPARRRVVVAAPAKLNLGLAIGPRRADGFHELVTVFQSVSLADTLVAERTARGFSLDVRHERVAVRGRPSDASRADVPNGPGNLVLRAARAVAERLGLPGGARFRLVKRIPSRAGLGGGSADAAAALHAMLALHGVRLPLRHRLELAAALGSDVPFALFGGTALGRGRGERLVRLAPPAPFRAILAVPAWRISTADAFARFDRSKYGLTGWNSTLRFAASLGRNQVTALDGLRLGNGFERVLGRHAAELESLRARMRAAGLPGPLLTGSGSGVFGILPRGVLIREVVSRFDGREQLFVVRSCRSGVRLRKRT